jgi:uncharacterized protein (DUF1499 family)
MRLPLAALGVAALGLLMLTLAGPAYRLGMSLDSASGILRAGGYVGLAAATLATVALALGHWWRPATRKVTAVALLAVVAGAVVAAIPYFSQRRVERAPRLHDITTDLDNPPAFDAIVPLRVDAPNSLERPLILVAQQREGYPDIAPLTISLSPDRAFTRALETAQAMGWEIVNADSATGHIEATDTTTWFGFTDDVVVRLTPWGSGTRVDVRSASRCGAGDAGRNAARIRDYLDRLEE